MFAMSPSIQNPDEYSFLANRLLLSNTLGKYDYTQLRATGFAIILTFLV
jgi:hypothetical protein